jgi:hypothetical protein
MCRKPQEKGDCQQMPSEYSSFFAAVALLLVPPPRYFPKPRWWCFVSREMPYKKIKPSTSGVSSAEKEDSADLLLPTERYASFLEITSKGTVQHSSTTEKQTTIICEQNKGLATFSAAVSSSSDTNHALLSNTKLTPPNRRSKRSKLPGMPHGSAGGTEDVKSNRVDSLEATQDASISTESGWCDYIHVSAHQENSPTVRNSSLLGMEAVSPGTTGLESDPRDGGRGIETEENYILLDSTRRT